MEKEPTLKVLRGWLDLVDKLQVSVDQYYNPYKKFYEEQFKDIFFNDEPDASTAPFEIPRQTVFYHLLDRAENTVLIADIPDDEKSGNS